MIDLATRTLRDSARRTVREINKAESAARKAERPKREKIDPAGKFAGEPAEATPRKAMTVGRRGRIIERQGYRCAGCNERVSVFEIDHTIPLELGGVEDDANLQALCGPCHRAKTNADAGQIAKAKRLAKKHFGPREKAKRPLRSRGLG